MQEITAISLFLPLSSNFDAHIKLSVKKSDATIVITQESKATIFTPLKNLNQALYLGLC